MARAGADQTNYPHAKCGVFPFQIATRFGLGAHFSGINCPRDTNAQTSGYRSLCGNTLAVC